MLLKRNQQKLDVFVLWKSSLKEIGRKVQLNFIFFF